MLEKYRLWLPVSEMEMQYIFINSEVFVLFLFFKKKVC